MAKAPVTIRYRGYEIDPMRDPHLDGGWILSRVEDATCFVIYPPDPDSLSLDVEAYTLREAVAAVDEHIANKGQNSC